MLAQEMREEHLLRKAEHLVTGSADVPSAQRRKALSWFPAFRSSRFALNADEDVRVHSKSPLASENFNQTRRS